VVHHRDAGAIGGWNGDFLNVNQEYRALFTYYLPEVP
jgi:hypothetical protein